MTAPAWPTSWSGALGLRLFDRLPRGWRLTLEGAQLLPRALGMEEAALALQREAITRETAAGLVRLSTTPLLLNHCVAPILTGLAQRERGLTLSLVGELRLADLLRGEADLALRLGEPAVPDLISRPVAQIHYAFFVRTDTSPDADKARFIALTEDAAFAPLREWLQAHTDGQAVAAQTNDLECAAALARNGWGVALLPRFLGNADVGLTLWSHATDLPAPRTLYLTMHPDVRRATRVRAVADALVAGFAALQSRL